MIMDFRCPDTAQLMVGVRVRRFIPIEAVAMRKLVQLNAAASLDFLRVPPPGNRLEKLRGNRDGSTASVSMTNGGCVLSGMTGMPVRLKLWTITDGSKAMGREVKWPHPGEVLLHEWLEPLGLSQYALARAIAVPPRRINEIVNGLRGISADTALSIQRETLADTLDGIARLEADADPIMPRALHPAVPGAHPAA